MKLNKIRKKLKKLKHQFKTKSGVRPDKLAKLTQKLQEKIATYKEKLADSPGNNKRHSLKTKLKVAQAQLKKARKLEAALAPVEKEKTE
ncbi:MAG: hypothetical protein KDI15_00415 [Thiothrix sp.]|nr:hypothetical protein [Thiothrix sp.]HPE60895.1 hypothetical protein [Thiolinea sp.]